MMNEVSVVIPCYQAETTVQRCLVSVMQQRSLPLEVILINDGSTDGTHAELMRIQSEWQDVCKIEIVKHEQNKGVAAARNAGWEIANGQLIAFLDADDSWHPEKLAVQSEWMHLHPEADLTCHAISEQMAFDPSGLTGRHVTEKSLLFKNQVLTSTVMLKREIPLHFNASQRYSEDYYLWLQLAFRGYGIYYLDAKLAMRFKAAYGVGGLSKQLWAMQLGELANYWALFQQQAIPFLYYVIASIFSTIKFVRRLVIHFCAQCRNKPKVI